MPNGNHETRKTVAQVAKEVNQHKTELELVKKDIKLMGDIHARLDITIDRLTEVSTSIKSMLAVHQQKIESQEKADSALFDLIDKRRKEAKDSIDDLHSRLSSIQREIRDKLDDAEKKHDQAHVNLEERLTEDIKLRSKEIDTKVAVLEKWKWVFLGGCIIAGFLLTKNPWFFNLLRF